MAIDGGVSASKLTRRVFIDSYLSLVESRLMGDMDHPMTMADLGEMLSALSAHGQHHHRELRTRWVSIERASNAY